MNVALPKRGVLLSSVCLVLLELVIAYLWWPLSPRPRSTIPLPADKVYILRGFSPDGKTLLAYYINAESYNIGIVEGVRYFGITTWDVPTGKVGSTWPGAFGWQALSDDGSLFASPEQQEDGTVVATVRSLGTGRVVLDLGRVRSFSCAEFNRGARFLVQLISIDDDWPISQTDYYHHRYLSVRSFSAGQAARFAQFFRV
jgi:hypothetical protein